MRPTKDLFRSSYGINDAARAARDFAPPVCVLGKITGATAIAGSTTRWEYDWEEASISAANALVAKPDGLLAQKGISVSELGNTATTAAYGVLITGLPGTFVPKQIPNGCAVLCFPYRRRDGSLIWLIVNTQAIDGTC